MPTNTKIQKKIFQVGVAPKSSYLLGSLYTYDAAGVKLNKESVSDATTTTTDYVGGIHYVDGDLDFLQHSEGRAVHDGHDYAYEYNLTDHLGNVHVVRRARGNCNVGYYGDGKRDLR